MNTIRDMFIFCLGALVYVLIMKYENWFIPFVTIVTIGAIIYSAWEVFRDHKTV